MQTWYELKLEKQMVHNLNSQQKLWRWPENIWNTNKFKLKK